MLPVNTRITICHPVGCATYRDMGKKRGSQGFLVMSKHWAANGSGERSAESETSGELSANGAYSDDAVVSDEAVEAQLVSTDEPAEQSPAAAEQIDEASVSEAAGDAFATPETAVADDEAAAAVVAEDDAAAAATAEDDAAVAATAETEVVEPVPADEGSLFVAELVRSMRATASLERAKIGEDTEQKRQAHIGLVRAREASEADRMRELAGEDMKAIEDWAEGETKRIQLERERRASELHQDLETSLAEHRSKIDREIETAEAAIATYQAEVDAFFARLDRETDLVVIARQAALRPVFPALSAVAAPVAAASVAATEFPTTTSDEPRAGTDGGPSGAGTSGSTGTGVGVMDPSAEPQPVESWAAQPDAQPEPVPAGAPDDTDRSGEAIQSAEPAVAAAGANHGTIGSLFVSVPVLHPMSWLRREANGGNPPNGEG